MRLLEGRILNRFTKDVAVIDENIPVTLFDFLQVGSQLEHVPMLSDLLF